MAASLRGLFLSGAACRNAASFDQLYSQIYPQIQFVNSSLKASGSSPRCFELLKTLLKIKTAVQSKSWAASSSVFRSFARDVNALQIEGRNQIESRPELRNRLSEKTIRWIKANELQMRFAVLKNLDEVPYRYEEIPAGAIVLTNPKSYLLGKSLEGASNLFHAILMKIKAIICWLLTGYHYTHAALSLGGGELYHVDKNGASLNLQGRGRIENKRGRVCFHDVLLPNRDLMTDASRRFFRVSEGSFQQLWGSLNREVRVNGLRARANFCTLLKAKFGSRREVGYNSAQDWNPGGRELICSAAISALFARYGIDIGAPFNLKNSGIMPSHFFRSRFFIPGFIAS